MTDVNAYLFEHLIRFIWLLEVIFGFAILFFLDRFFGGGVRNRRNRPRAFRKNN